MLNKFFECSQCNILNSFPDASLFITAWNAFKFENSSRSHWKSSPWTPETNILLGMDQFIVIQAWLFSNLDFGSLRVASLFAVLELQIVILLSLEETARGRSLKSSSFLSNWGTFSVGHQSSPWMSKSWALIFCKVLPLRKSVLLAMKTKPWRHLK